MSEQLAYALITPYSLDKSRVGGMIARLIARTGLNVVAARMFAPSREFAAEYAELLRAPGHADCEKMRALLSDYAARNFPPSNGLNKRIMVLLLQGENAVQKVHEVAGELAPGCPKGVSIAETFGDLIFDAQDTSKVVYFEPAIITANTPQGVTGALKLFLKYYQDGGILRNTAKYPEGVRPQISLTMLKPDNFRFASARPGHVLDFFSGTGLNIVGIKVQQMATAQAMEFYGPVRDTLRTKLGGRVTENIFPDIEKTLGCQFDEATKTQVGEILCPTYGDSQFDNIVRFMSGRSESECPAAERQGPGTVTSWVIIFEGPDAITKIRQTLGPTNPAKATPGTIRREFGTDMMVNAAHASDSDESAAREIGILVEKAPNLFKSICEKFIA
jgi:nucleoside diphosphate kinase